MAKKVVLEVEDYTKVLSFVSDQKISVPGAVEAFTILNEAIMMDITVLEPELSVHDNSIRDLSNEPEYTELPPEK